MNNANFTALHLSNLADQAERFMLMCYERLPRSLVLHNDSWALSLAAHSLEIALRRPGVSPDLPPLARTMALLYACRYWGPDNQLREWTDVAREFREWTGPDYLNLQLTLATVLPDGRSNLRVEIADVLYDAQLAQRLLSGTEGAELTWLENRYASPSGQGPLRDVSRPDALRRYLDELRDARFRDGELRRRYQHTHSAVLLDLQKLVDKLVKKKKRSSVASIGKKDGHELHLRSAETSVRSVYYNQIRLQQHAGIKSAIAVGVNVLLLGALITLVGYGDRVWAPSGMLLPVILISGCTLASLIYAVLAARLHHRRGAEGHSAAYDIVGRHDPEDFDPRSRETPLDTEAPYGKLIGDLHVLSGSVARKYRLLTISYTVFSIGLAASIVLIVGLLLFAAG